MWCRYLVWPMLAAAPVAAQQTPTDPVHRLTTPEARSVETFSLIRGLRELSDGRVLISDWIEERIVALDLDRGMAAPVGRIGPGPSEYRLPSRLIALPGDSTLLLDVGNSRLSVIGPDLVIHRALGSPPGLRFAVSPRAADGAGRLYFAVARWARIPDQPGGDSVAVYRWDPGTNALDRVGVVLGARRPDRAGRPRMTPGIPIVPFAPQDAWAVAADGGIAFVRAGDYSVEWGGTGPSRRGPPNAYPPLSVTRADKLAWVARFNASSPMSGRGADGGLGHTPASFQTPESIARDVETNEFADRHPYFTAGGAWIAPDGSLWVERSAHAGTPQTFDVFDHAGRRAARVVLPVRRRLIGFGRGTLYAAATDDLDLQTVERYRRPGGPPGS